MSRSYSLKRNSKSPTKIEFVTFQITGSNSILARAVDERGHCNWGHVLWEPHHVRHEL